MLKKHLLLLLLISNFPLLSNRTISVIIPCHPKHSGYLYDLLKIYEKQTLLPNEVLISISEIKQIDPIVIKKIQTEPWTFPVKLFFTEQKLFAGQNRNIACNHAVGDIIVCQDADDFPHPQRLEIIKYFFDKYNVDFLLHKFIYNSNNMEINKIQPISDIDLIKYDYIHTYHEAWIVGYMLFGQPAFRREIFNQVHWPDIPIDEDNVFANKIITTYNGCMMIHCPLYIYRLELSASPYELYRQKFGAESIL